MAIPSRQIGWSEQQNLLWNISKQLEQLISVCSKVSVTPSPANELLLTFDNIANANLLIGGSSSDVTNWNTFFDLPINGTAFTSVSVIGNTVNLIGGGSIHLRDSIFDDAGGYSVSLLTIVDTLGCIVSAGSGVFGNYINNGCPNLTRVNLPNLITAARNCFAGCLSLTSINVPLLMSAGDFCFSNCTSLTTVNLPNLITAGESCFYYCISLTLINLPSLTTADNWCFYYCTSLTSISLPVCTNLGTTTGNDSVFSNIAGNTITLTVPEELLTCNGGNADVDIIDLGFNNTVTVNGSSYIPFTGHTGDLSLTFDFISSANTLVGDSTNVDDWNIFFNLPVWSTLFTSVSVIGNTVNLIGGENIIFNRDLLAYNNTILEINDTGCVCYIGTQCFYYCASLTTVNLPSLTTTGKE